MANKIYIEYRSYEDESISTDATDNIVGSSSFMIANSNVLELPLLDDVKIEAQSQFSSFNEMLPQILGDVMSQVTALQAGITGTIGSGLLELKNKFDLPKWQKTDPITVNVVLGFFTKTNSYRDVYLPAKQIIGMSILSKDPNDEDVYRVPGISLTTAKEYSIQTQNGSNNTTIDSLKSKLIAFEIPGIVYVPLAYVSQAIPTYSKQITENAYPLWCQLDCTFVSVSPATTDVYNNARSSIRKSVLSGQFDIAKKSSKILG